MKMQAFENTSNGLKINDINKSLNIERFMFQPLVVKLFLKKKNGRFSF